MWMFSGMSSLLEYLFLYVLNVFSIAAYKESMKMCLSQGKTYNYKQLQTPTS